MLAPPPPVQEFNGITKRDKPLSAPRCLEGGHGASTPPSHLPACGGGERRCQESAGAPPSALEPRNPPLLPRKPLASLNSGGAICSRVLSASSSVLQGDEVPGWVGGTPNLGGGCTHSPHHPGVSLHPPSRLKVGKLRHEVARGGFAHANPVGNLAACAQLGSGTGGTPRVPPPPGSPLAPPGPPSHPLQAPG